MAARGALAEYCCQRSGQAGCDLPAGRDRALVATWCVHVPYQP